jgi:hemolysin D
MHNFSISDSPNGRSPLFDPTIEDWSSTTQETLDALPQHWSRSVLYLMVACGAVAIPWSMVAQVDEVGSARGRLEPKGSTIRLDAAVSGSVSAVKAKEGQQVQAGDPLLEIKSDQVQAELQQAQTKLEGLLNRLTQLSSIKAQLEVAVQTQQQQGQAQALEQVEQINQLQRRLAFHQSAAGLTRSVLMKDHDKVERFRKFRRQGIIPGIQVEEAERAMIEAQQRVQLAHSEIEQTQSEIEKQRVTYQRVVQQGNLAVIESERQISELQAQMTDLQTEIQQTKTQIKTLQDRWQQRVIKVPVEGTIFQLPVQHAGAVVQTGQMVAQLAPKGAPLVLRAQMESKQSGFIRPGLPVKVKFDAYPFQDYGIVQGYVRWVSPDSKGVEAGPSQAQVFDVEIELERSYIEVGGKQVALNPGQTANAEIIIRQRKAIDFVLDPFKKLQKNGINL